MKAKFIVGLLLILTSCASHDKQNRHYHQLIAPKQLKKDVNYVQKNLQKMHPDLYWYITKEALDFKFDSLRNSLNEALTPNEFFMKISPIVAAVGQGHMSMNMVNLTSSDSLKKKYKNSKHPLDGFEFEYHNERLYIKNIYSKKDTVLQTGSEILSINNLKPQVIFEKYRKTFTSDGYNQTAIPKFFGRRFSNYLIAEVGFVDSLNLHISCADSIFHHTLTRTFRTKSKKSDKKDIQIADQKKDSLTDSRVWTKEALKARKIAKKAEQKILNRKKKWYGYDTKSKTFAKDLSYPIAKDSTIALLKITNFSKGKVKVYDRVFSEIAHNKVTSLIIDIRGNPGGRLHEIYKLSQYLNDSTYRFIQPATITKRSSFFHLFKGQSVATKIFGAPFISAYASFRGLSAKRDSNGNLKLPLKSSKSTEPKTHNYQNNLYVITDGMTFSAAAIISSHLKGRNRAVFVGNETGGTFNGTVAGIMPVLKLPHSKLKIRVGLMSIKPIQQTDTEGFGVQPDVKIIPSIDETINEDDPELQWILEDIAKKRVASKFQLHLDMDVHAFSIPHL